MSYESLELTVDDGIARLVLNQPEIGNPFNAPFCAEWAMVANDISARKDVRAVLITARGKFFSVGGDIQMFSQNRDVLPDKIREWTSGLHIFAYGAGPRTPLLVVGRNARFRRGGGCRPGRSCCR